jgi:RHS repeat-associated protein
VKSLICRKSKRVEKCTEGSTPGTCASGATGTLYWRGLGSDPLSETDLAGNVQNTYVFFNGQRIARRDSSGLIHYYFSDHLGTHGVVENATASNCEQDIDYYPYGGVENDYCPNVAQNYKFTGKERDSESGLDYFGARHHASALGRFTAPDQPFADQHVASPQSWNLYSYVLNNPLKHIDPNGKQVVTITYDAFIPSQTATIAGFKYAGDNRGFSTSPKASSRISISVTVETDPAKAANPLIGTPQVSVGSTTRVSPRPATDTCDQGLPTAGVSRDAAGNVVINIRQMPRIH